MFHIVAHQRACALAMLCLGSALLLAGLLCVALFACQVSGEIGRDGASNHCLGSVCFVLGSNDVAVHWGP